MGDVSSERPVLILFSPRCVDSDDGSSTATMAKGQGHVGDTDKQPCGLMSLWAFFCRYKPLILRVDPSALGTHPPHHPT